MSINFCQKVNLNLLGLVENMSGYACPHCGQDLPLFNKGGGKKTAQAASVPFLGSLPFDPQVVEAADNGKLLNLKAEASLFFQALSPIADYLREILPLTKPAREPGVMKIVVPVDNGRLAEVFGKAPTFALFQVKDGAVIHQELLPRPAHEPGGVPEWLDDLGVTHIIAGNMGEKAQKLLAHKGLEVVAGAPPEAPEVLVEQYLKNTLETMPPPAPSCGGHSRSHS
jgi:predicted Fe-Mo cluster-binding NifX family protein